MSTTDLQKYVLVWQPCVEGSTCAQRFHVPGYVGQMPFFVYGEEVDRILNGGVELREEHLLKGILYGLYEADRGNILFPPGPDRPTMLYLLDVLGRMFGYTDQEKLILNVAADVRGKNGSRPSSCMLYTGLSLLPASARIRSDLIMDLWILLAAETDLEIRTRDLGSLVALIGELDMKDIYPGPREIIAYMGLLALLVLGRQASVPGYLETVVRPHVTDPALLARIDHLVQNPGEARIKPLFNAEGTEIYI